MQKHLSMRLLVVSAVIVLFLPHVHGWDDRRRVCLAVSCQMSNWISWTSCTAPCGTGTRSRTRFVVTAASCGGTICPTLRAESKACNTGCCPVSCVWSWSSWSSCLGFASSTQYRTAVIARLSSCGGISCPTEQNVTRVCDTGR